MNDWIKQVSEECDAAPEASDVRQSVKQLLSSPEFTKAPRMSTLLSFLVEKKLAGMEHQITECGIGLELFQRDARLFNTTLDPVVRVQVGRLRTRLSLYYAALVHPPLVQISIPKGNYVPCFSQPISAQQAYRYKSLQVAPLRNLTSEPGGKTFVSGLDEELGSRLFHAFGSAIELREARQDSQAEGADQAPPHRLEGSIRVEDKNIRASMRLVDTGAGNIAWLSKFDFRGNLCMSVQEKLASAICAELGRHLVVF